MSAFSVIVNILAIIALIIIISYIIIYIYNYFQKKQNQHIASIIMPPGPYMQNSGIKCPDYWVNTGVDTNGNYICKNSFNIASVNPTTGVAAGKCNSEQLSFTPIDSGYTWEMNNPNGLTSYTREQKYNFLNTSSVNNSLTRCQWINNCGPSSNVQGIWSGVNEICNGPSLSS
jgi:hypothetical protein